VNYYSLAGEPAESETRMEKKMVVVTTDKDCRGVFMGELLRYDEDKQIAVLKDAQMAVHWSQATKGVLGLAAHGPQKGSRITPQIPQIEVNKVASVMSATDKAVTAWRTELWD